VQFTDILLPDFDHETASTRLLLERAPESRSAWTPHARSSTLGDLCMHLARIPFWGVMVMQGTSYDLDPPDGSAPAPARYESHAATLHLFDANVAQARAAIANATDVDFRARWTLQQTGRTLFTMPRVSVLRSFVLSHMIHHRGQLSVYLRLCDVPLPPIYGPTADSPRQEV
jgi:uncharacterized damage-inducible protein DinB